MTDAEISAEMRAAALMLAAPLNIAKQFNIDKQNYSLADLESMKYGRELFSCNMSKNVSSRRAVGDQYRSPPDSKNIRLCFVFKTF